MESALIQGSVLNNCWDRIGVGGDLSCPKLKTYIHCRNCPVYSAGGRSLLERQAPIGYIDEWTELLAETKVGDTANEIEVINTKAVIVFRLGVEWLALSANLFQEVTQPAKVHTIPHRSNEILLGVVNIRGEILLCISLCNLLGLEIEKFTNSIVKSNSVAHQRMVVVEKDKNRWVFTADEVSSIQRFHLKQFRSAPAVVTKASESFTKSVINWQDRQVNYLDDELLFYTLNKRFI